MEVDNLVETTIANYQEERPVVHLDAVVNEDADPLINLLLHLFARLRFISTLVNL